MDRGGKLFCFAQVYSDRLFALIKPVMTNWAFILHRTTGRPSLGSLLSNLLKHTRARIPGLKPLVVLVPKYFGWNSIRNYLLFICWKIIKWDCKDDIFSGDIVISNSSTREEEETFQTFRSKPEIFFSLFTLHAQKGAIFPPRLNISQVPLALTRDWVESCFAFYAPSCVIY